MVQPPSNIMMSCFNKILDCPDILEVVVQVWKEDYFDKYTITQKKSIKEAKMRAEEFAIRIYPILFSDSFQYFASRRTETAAGNEQLLKHRKELVLHALRFNNDRATKKVPTAPEQMTTFKPFSIKEIEYEVW